MGDYRRKVVRLKRYLRHHHVVKPLRDEVDSHLRKVGKHIGINLGSFLDELPGGIRLSVAEGLYYPLYENMALFAEAPFASHIEFENKICQAVEAVFYRPFEVITSKGSTLVGLQYLSDGFAGLDSVGVDNYTKEYEWLPGSYLFLETIFAKSHICISGIDVKAVDACEVWFLARDAFDRILREVDPEVRHCIDSLRLNLEAEEASLAAGGAPVAHNHFGMTFETMEHLVKYGLPRAWSNECTYDVFLSYTQRDNAAKLLATDLYYVLSEAGKRCWLDVKMDRCDRAAMMEGVDNAKAFFAIVTDNGVDSYFSREMCRDEVMRAIHSEKTLVPVIAVSDKPRVTDFLAEGLSFGIDLSNYNFCHYDRSGPEYAEASLRTICAQANIVFRPCRDVETPTLGMAGSRGVTRVMSWSGEVA